MAEEYFLESMRYKKDGGLWTIKLSSIGGDDGDHYDCITIHGSKYGVRNRALRILYALNDETSNPLTFICPSNKN